jgi:hypothetical protein
VEHRHFDRLTLAFADRSSRRRFGHLLLTLTLGAGIGLPTLLTEETDARKRRKRKNNNQDKPGPCKPDCKGKACGPDGCGGSCGQCPAEHYCSARKRQCVSYCGSIPAL